MAAHAQLRTFDGSFNQSIDGSLIRRFSAAMVETYNRFGELTDPAEAYQQFMLGLHDILAEASDEGYSTEACRRLAEARLLFMDEFEQRHPGYGKGRAVWR